MGDEKIKNALRVPLVRSAEVGRQLAGCRPVSDAEKIMKYARPAFSSGIVHSHFNVEGEAPQRQLLAWCARVGHIIDVLPSVEQIEHPFNASIDRYAVGELVFTDCRSAPLLLERSLARISTDNIRDHVFHVFIEGGAEDLKRGSPQCRTAPSAARMLALDMNKPIRMQRSVCRVLTFFAPRALVEAVFPDAETLHGRVIETTTPLTQLLVEHVVSLNRNMTVISAREADSGLRTGVQLLLAVFGKQAHFSGNARATVRAAMFGRARRYI